MAEKERIPASLIVNSLKAEASAEEVELTHGQASILGVLTSLALVSEEFISSEEIVEEAKALLRTKDLKMTQELFDRPRMILIYKRKRSDDLEPTGINMHVSTINAKIKPLGREIERKRMVGWRLVERDRLELSELEVRRLRLVEAGLDSASAAHLANLEGKSFLLTLGLARGGWKTSSHESLAQAMEYDLEEDDWMPSLRSYVRAVRPWFRETGRLIKAVSGEGYVVLPLEESK